MQQVLHIIGQLEKQIQNPPAKLLENARQVYFSITTTSTRILVNINSPWQSPEFPLCFHFRRGEIPLTGGQMGFKWGANLEQETYIVIIIFTTFKYKHKK